MILNLTDLSSLPLYEQISNQITEKILTGELEPETKLLPMRSLARKHHINVSSVKRAYEKLDKEGFIYLKKGDDFYYIAPHRTELKKSGRVTARYEINDDSITRQRLQKELEMAREIQAELLPKPLPDRLGFSIEGYIEPSSEIGGDFYNIIPLGRERWGIVIGDACGQGFPAALLAAQSQAVIASELRHKQNLKKMMQNVNKYIFSSTPADKFVTMVTGIYDKKKRTFTYCNAGHEHPLVIRAGHTMKTLNSSSPGLGMMKTTSYEIDTITLHNQDMIFMYTDGLTEVRDGKKNEYGMERLQQVLQRNKEKDAGKVIERVLLDVKKFSGEYSSEDDRTILIMQITPDS